MYAFYICAVCIAEYRSVTPYRVGEPPVADPKPFRRPFSVPPLFPQQAFNATAVVRHMRKLQLGTSQEGQGQTGSHGELLTPTAGGKNQGLVEGHRWSMRKNKAGAGAGSTATLTLSLYTGPAAGCCCRDCCVEPGSELPPAPPPSSRAMD